MRKRRTIKFWVIPFTAYLHPSHPKYGTVETKVEGHAGITGADQHTVRAVLNQLLTKNSLILDQDHGGTYYESNGKGDSPKEKELLQRMRDHGYYLEVGVKPLEPGKN